MCHWTLNNYKFGIINDVRLWRLRPGAKNQLAVVRRCCLGDDGNATKREHKFSHTNIAGNSDSRVVVYD